ncbi:MAG: histidine phosphatase family protein [Balneolaceae bacterium]
MSKKILIMRHAKSSWDNSSLRDFDRPLNERGERDAPRMGRYLQELGMIPNQIVSSPAARAKATILKVSEEVGYHENKILWNEDLYFKGSNAYIESIRRMNDESEVVMAVGHYPMVDEVVSGLHGQMLKKHFGTATIACLESESEQWSDVEPGSCKLLWMVSPKELSKDS